MFGCAITIPDHEKQACSDLCRPAWIALSLTNDLFSWDKEQRDTAKKGQTYVSNALCVIMQEHSVSLEEAKNMCQKEIRRNVKEYLNIVERAKQENNHSVDLLRFMDGLVYSIGGNLVWSMTCPRYHADTHFNAQQVEWMTNGIPNHLRSEKPAKALRRQPGINRHANGQPERRPGQTIANGNAKEASHSKELKSTQGSLGVPITILTDVIMDKHLPELPTDVCNTICKLIHGLILEYGLTINQSLGD